MSITASLPASGSETAPLVVRTVALADSGDLLDLLPKAHSSTAWVRRAAGLVGWGVAAQIRTSGPDRFERASQWWAERTRHAVVRDEVGLPGTGLIAFGSFAFSDSDESSVLLVPAVVVGRRDGLTWVTTISRAALTTPPAVAPTNPPLGPGAVTFAEGAQTSEQWAEVVATAVGRISAGDLEKVVLARDLIATTTKPLDVRWPLRRLASAYETCWTFHVDGLFGATPELLVRRERGLVTSRVLAGTIRRTGDDDHDLHLAAQLARSSKDLEEHEYAVRSVADALAPHCTSMNVPEAPFVLHLPNVMHLATDVAGVIDDATTSLDLAAALHPSAAVGGTPTPAALALIDEIEGMDRGRYAGPVGWIDAKGDGEWGIALRSAQITPDGVRLFAGCGIVAESQPSAELAESNAKFLPVRTALNDVQEG